MLIDDYDLDVFTPPCSPETTHFSAIVRLTSNIRELLPYLNAALDGAHYNPAAPALTTKIGGHRVVFAPHQIAIAQVEDRTQAAALAAQAVALANRTWAGRADLTPDHSAHRRPVPMAVYKLLPGTNCQACGQPTCYNFALQLVAGGATLDDCPPLGEDAYVDNRGQLRAMLGVIS